MEASIKRFKLYRPVLEFERQTIRKVIYEALAEAKQSSRPVDFLPCAAVNIISPADLSHFSRVSGYAFDSEAVGGLGDYLEDHMSDSAEDEHDVPCLPFAERRLKVMGRGWWRVFSLGAQFEPVYSERAEAKHLVEKFSGQQQSEFPDSNLWPEQDNVSDLWLCLVKDKAPAVSVVRDVLTSADIVTSGSYQLGKIALDDGSG